MQRARFSIYCQHCFPKNRTDDFAISEMLMWPGRPRHRRFCCNFSNWMTYTLSISTAPRWSISGPYPERGECHPLLSDKLPGRFTVQKRCLIAPSLSFPNLCIFADKWLPDKFSVKFYLEIIDDVTGQVKGKILAICSRWLRQGRQPYLMETNPIQRHGSCLEYF